MKIDTAKNSDPFELVQLVFNAILGKLAAAKACIERDNIADKGLLISEVITLIGSLESSLDMEKGGEISNNLANLYQFCASHLVTANVENDIAKIDEVHGIILTIKEAWDQIPKETRAEFLDKDAASA